MNEPKTYESIFNMKTIAVVSMSPKPERPSHFVALYMRNQGYTIIPVNPGQNEIAGETCYSSLKDVPTQVDVVNVFRSPKYVGPIVDAAIEIGAKSVWLQVGVINEEAAQSAEVAGLHVIMNDCMMRKHKEIS